MRKNKYEEYKRKSFLKMDKKETDVYLLYFLEICGSFFERLECDIESIQLYNKYSNYFDKVICIKCKKKRIHYQNGLCGDCYNNFKEREAISRRRLKLKGFINPIEITTKTQTRIIERDKLCVYCRNNERLEIDHITAIANNGNNDYNNLVLSCRKCNSSKGDKDVFEWCKEKGIEIPKIVIELLNKQKEQIKLEV